MTLKSPFLLLRMTKTIMASYASSGEISRNLMKITSVIDHVGSIVIDHVYSIVIDQSCRFYQKHWKTLKKLLDTVSQKNLKFVKGNACVKLFKVIALNDSKKHHLYLIFWGK